MVSMRGQPSGWFSSDFEVFDRIGASFGRVDLSSWRENATLQVGSKSFKASHESFQKEFALSDESGSVVIVAEKPSAWKSDFYFEYADNRYELKKESSWKRDFVISREGAGTVGGVRSEGMFKRGWNAEIPDELPDEVKLFLTWLVVLMWQRDDSAASTSAST